MKARLLTFFEIEERFKEIIIALEREPLDERFVVEKGVELLLGLGVCISQMKASNSAYYPEKSSHLEILENAKSAITYKLNSCTIEEINIQVNSAYRAFGVQ